MYTQIKRYNKQRFFFPDVKSFLTVLSNEPVIYAIKNLIGCNKATSITFFNFETLYTNIPHDKRKRVFNKDVDIYF